MNAYFRFAETQHWCAAGIAVAIEAAYLRPRAVAPRRPPQ
jgi:hypothetical protein